MVEQDSVAAVHVVCLTVVPREFETSTLADAVRTPRVEPCGFYLRHFGNLAKHLTTAGKVEATIRAALADPFQDKVRSIDIRIHGREAVHEALSHETLRSQVIDFIKLVGNQNTKDTRVAFQARAVEFQIVNDTADSRKPTNRVLEGNASNQAMAVSYTHLTLPTKA